jgi:sec-independent protein translocase protein TatA
MFGNLGPGELILIFLVLLLVFGAKRLPELGSGLGKGIREFKKSMREINTEIERPVDDAQLNRPAQTSRPAVPASTENKDQA